jgi:L-ribulose-5-phosphate 4-epimerase
LPECLLSGHASFTWGETSQKAFENALEFDAIAQIEFHSIFINSDIKFPNYILGKHFSRKHVANSYYGQ